MNIHELSDEQILALNSTMNTETDNDPLVHHRTPVQDLLKEYQENEFFYKKIKALGNMSLYRLKRDGDCFYRGNNDFIQLFDLIAKALCFGWLWTWMHQTAADSEKNVISFSQTTELLQKNGFDPLSYEDFYEEVLLALSLLKPSENQDFQAKEKDLLRLINIPEKSNAMVVYFRFLTSAYIKQNAYEYAPFLDVPSVTDVFSFCENTIECIGKEADHVMINALNFLEVETPVLSGTTGGAMARPFHTYANSLNEKKIFLRIAPELWLKRLIIGGFDKIFEIGKCFRNEGLDSNHNSEFTICEFYQTYASLEDLIDMTKTLLSGLTKELFNNNFLKGDIFSLVNSGFFNNYKILDFVSSLEEYLGMPLPHLDSPLAIHELLCIADKKNIVLLKPHTVSRILDQFFDQFLTPQCNEPTFIVHYPQIMSPLAKSSEKDGQKIAHRAELYIFGKEICNFYEEENCPVQQRLKMLQQQENHYYCKDLERQMIDSNYINALEWGLPPTGGWGMGIDRLCMILSGMPRINEVLSFGNLRMTSG
ncbi:hypothetical protein PCK2_000324 [Pneumocystis canis]|nr:hypothetical protein PCK2_000324 [Pneumocystis canis]